MARDKAEPRLKPQEMRFAVAYAETGAKKDAAITAGWNEKSAAQAATKMLDKPQVVQFIDDLLDAQAAKAGVTGERVVRELADLAFFDVREVLEVETIGPMSRMKVKPSRDWSRIAAAAVSEVSMGPEGIKVKFHSKVQALTKLAEHLDLFRVRDDRNAKAAASLLAAIQGTPLRPTTDA